MEFEITIILLLYKKNNVILETEFLPNFKMK